jgi:hypothetical protein
MIDNIINEPITEQTQVIRIVTPEQPEKKRATTVSYSQYAMWLKCPFQWKLSYMDYLAPYEASLNTAFGDGIHHALQVFLTTLYEKSAVEADALDTFALFKVGFDEALKRVKNPDLTEIAEFEEDARVMLGHVTGPAIRNKHFPSRVYEVVGVELPLEIPIRGGKITYKGYLDIVLRDKKTKKILILDFKTSTYGWNKYQKMDRTKLDQLLLYKRFYNQVYGTPMSDINIEFFIMKRKLYEDVAFPQQRIQRITPPNGKICMCEVEKTFLEFINECFTPVGEFNREHQFLKNPGKGKKYCKWCLFKTLINPKTGEKYCDGKESE